MKVVILAGGFGTRISEESYLKPKPMVEIGDKPMIWHIMKIYSHYGFNDFVICCGYKGQIIKEYFANYFLYSSNITIDLANNNIEVHNNESEPWKVTLVDTGLKTMTGGRVKRIQKYIDEEEFMLTYGDGVSNVNINELLKFHYTHGKIATISSTQPAGRFGALDVDENSLIHSFREKPKEGGSWVNAGFAVFNRKVFDYIEGDHTILENVPYEKLATDGEMMAFRHNGFWYPMDTIRDKELLENLWNNKEAPWKVW